VKDDEVLAANIGLNVLERKVVRRRVDQLGAFDEGCRLRKPSRLPKRAHLALHLVARAGTSIITVEGGGLQKKCSHSGAFQVGVTEPSVSTR
jgi:hypothetical protein